MAGELRAAARQTLDPPVRMLLTRIVKIVVLLFAGMIAMVAAILNVSPCATGNSSAMLLSASLRPYSLSIVL
jgi:hypothetical protein